MFNGFDTSNDEARALLVQHYPDINMSTLQDHGYQLLDGYHFDFNDNEGNPHSGTVTPKIWLIQPNVWVDNRMV